MVRLFDLPDRLRNNVLSQLTWTQLFDVSCCSAKAKEKVMEYTSEKDDIPTIGIFLDEQFCITTLNTSFIFSDSRQMVTEDLMPAPRTVITGGETLEINFAHIGAGHLECVVDEHRERTLFHFVRYLIEVLRTHCDYLRVTPVYIEDMTTILESRLFRQLEVFELKAGSISTAEMTWFLTRFRSNKWVITSNTGIEYEFRSRFSALDSLKAETWRMLPESTALLRTPLIILRDPPHLNNRWINRFIRTWKHSSLDVLTRFEVHFTKQPGLNLDEMMRGCTPFQGRDKRYDVPGWSQDILPTDFQNGLDVRKRGGKWASLLMFDRRNYHILIPWNIRTILIFAVWSEPDPHL